MADKGEGMNRDSTHFFLLNLGHFFDHFFTLIFATVAALALSRDWHLGYAELLKYATPGFFAFGLFADGFWSALALRGLAGLGWAGSYMTGLKLLADQVDMIFDNIPGSLAQMAGGKVWGLAVTGTEPSPMAPEVPTMASFLPGYDINSWGGICGPAGVPQPIVDKLNALARQALESDDVKKAYLKNGATPMVKSVADTVAYRRAE